jgi:hypothetical protein
MVMPDEALLEARLHDFYELARQRAEQAASKIDAKARRRR